MLKEKKIVGSLHFIFLERTFIVSTEMSIFQNKCFTPNYLVVCLFLNFTINYIRVFQQNWCLILLLLSEITLKFHIKEQISVNLNFGLGALFFILIKLIFYYESLLFKNIYIYIYNNKRYIIWFIKNYIYIIK